MNDVFDHGFGGDSWVAGIRGLVARLVTMVLGLMCPAAAGDWVELSAGDGLQGWKVECVETDRGKSYWSQKGGVIECDTKGDKGHDYVWLVSEREFGDFELEVLVRTFPGRKGNSGIQFRSRYGQHPEHPEKVGWLHGPQVDIHPPGPWRSGLIYDETWEARRWISPSLANWKIGKEKAPADWRWVHADGSVALSEGRTEFAGAPDAPDRDGWNHVRILARGTLVQVEVNGIEVTHYDGKGVLDDAAHQRHRVGMRGHIAFQLHARNDLKIQFKEVRIRDLGTPD